MPATATGLLDPLDDDVRHSNAHVASVSPHGHMRVRARLAKAFVRAHRSIIIDRAAAHSHFRPSLIGIIADTKGAWRPFPKAHLKIGVTDLFTSTASLISSKYQAVAKLCVLAHLTTLSSFLSLQKRIPKHRQQPVHQTSLLPPCVCPCTFFRPV